MYEKFERYFALHVRELRESTRTVFDPPLATNKVFQALFAISAMSFWDGLPKNISKSESLGIFKRKLFKYLLDKD